MFLTASFCLNYFWKDAGVHARDSTGRFYTIFESPEYNDETTGLAFSPDGKCTKYKVFENGHP
jgi:hypothetical protein